MRFSLGILFCFLFLTSYSQNKKSCEFYEEDKNINLFAFIGEKISLKEVDPNKITAKDTLKKVSFIMDSKFIAKYKVIKPIYNNLMTDTLEFVVYDHYGRPSFEKHDYVILYVSKSKKGDYYFHQKYQFDAVWKNKKGNWKGKKGKSIEKLFNSRKDGVLTARGVFK